MAKRKKKNPAAVALGHLGGTAAAGAGWRAWAAKMTPEERSEHGRKAVQARWALARKCKAARNKKPKS